MDKTYKIVVQTIDGGFHEFIADDYNIIRDEILEITVGEVVHHFSYRNILHVTFD